MNKYQKEPTIAEIEANPWVYHTWMLLELDDARTWLKQEIQTLRTKRNKLARKGRK